MSSGRATSRDLLLRRYIALRERTFSFCNRHKERLYAENGQGMTEYIILVVLVSLVCIPVFYSLPKAVLGYVRPFYYCISRPFP